MDEQSLALEHYRALGNVNTLIERDVSTLWRTLEGSNSLTALAALLEAVPVIGATYSDMTASLAMDYYETAREVADVPGSFTARPAAAPDPSRLETLTRWAVEPVFASAPQPELVPQRLTAPLSRIVANVARETVVASADADKKAVGWKRITRPGSCDFCRLLEGRGAVYHKGSRFASHTHCHCSAAPAFEGSTVVPVRAFQASKVKQSEADKARLRAYMKKKRDAAARAAK